MAAAAGLFNRRGLKGVKLADIARDVGLATNSVTYYFRKKEDLAAACLLRSIDAYEDLMRRAASGGSPQQRIARLFEYQALQLQAIAAGEQPALMFFSDLRALPAPHAASLFERYTNLFRGLRRLLVDPHARLVSRQALNARTHLLLASSYETRSTISPRFAPDMYPRVAARMVDIVSHGFAAAGEDWPVDDWAGNNQDSPQQSAWTRACHVRTAADGFLRAATALVNEKGYRGASVEQISARMNVTKGSFYHHIDHKDHLIERCFERSFEVLDRVLSHAESQPGSGWLRLCGVVRWLAHYQLGPDGPLLHTSASSALPDAARRRAAQTAKALADRMSSLIVDGMMDGSIRPLDPAIAAQALLGALNALSDIGPWVSGIDPKAVDEIAVRPILTGLLGR